LPKKGGRVAKAVSRSTASRPELQASEASRDAGAQAAEHNETNGRGSHPYLTMPQQSRPLEAHGTAVLLQQQMESTQRLDSEANSLIQNASDDARMRELEGIVELVGRLQLQFGRVQQQLQHALDAPLGSIGDASSSAHPASVEIPPLTAEVVLQLNASVAATLLGAHGCSGPSASAVPPVSSDSFIVEGDDPSAPL